MTTKTHTSLFTPVQIGANKLKHRVVMPAMSRLRASWPSGTASDLMLEYYTQRASDGGLIITEANAVAAEARSYHTGPGLYSDEQVSAWKKIVDSVHAKRESYICATFTCRACHWCSKYRWKSASVTLCRSNLLGKQKYSCCNS